jgi:hypothetical protein
MPEARRHIERLALALGASSEGADRVEGWGGKLATRMASGARLLPLQGA